MDPTMLVVSLVVIVGVIAAVVIFQRTRKTGKLRDRFGPEYSKAVEEAGSRRQAEAGLTGREKRVEGFSIHPLGASDKERYVTAWRRVQADFVDDPKAAVTQADDLLGQVMSTRGYPVADFAQRAADLSVDHPTVVENYRTAHDIAERHAGGQASTEDLRQAMVHYRSLFDDLVGDVPAPAASEIRP